MNFVFTNRNCLTECFAPMATTDQFLRNRILILMV